MNEIRWKRPLASLEYLYEGGVGDMKDYFEEEAFLHDVLDANDCGEPVCVVLYRDENGNRLLQSDEWMALAGIPTLFPAAAIGKTMTTRALPSPAT